MARIVGPEGAKPPVPEMGTDDMVSAAQKTALEIVTELSGTDGFHCTTVAQLRAVARIADALDRAFQSGMMEAQMGMNPETELPESFT